MANSATTSGTKRPLPADSSDEDDDDFDGSIEADNGNNLELLSSIFVDCDPGYIESRLAWHGNRPDVLSVVIEELTDQRYPRIQVLRRLNNNIE